MKEELGINKIESKVAGEWRKISAKNTENLGRSLSA